MAFDRMNENTLNDPETPADPDTTTEVPDEELELLLPPRPKRLLPDFPENPIGLVIIPRAGANQDSGEEALAARLREGGIGTLIFNLLTEEEERYPDSLRHVAMLSQRLLDCLSRIKRDMDMQALPRLPIGFFAADAISPAAVRVAAQRDMDVAAVVCHDGLIDLAGMLYLRSLRAPLLVIAAANNSTATQSNQRALRMITASTELRSLPPTPSDSATDCEEGNFTALAEWSIGWFGQGFAAATQKN